jgi:hypothetical protein
MPKHFDVLDIRRFVNVFSCHWLLPGASSGVEEKLHLPLEVNRETDGTTRGSQQTACQGSN